MRKILASALLAALFITSCTPKSTATTSAPAAATSTAEQMAQGKTIFDNACGKCHKLPDPNKFTSVEWVGIMNRMAPKARLSDEQHQWVYDYIVSAQTK